MYTYILDAVLISDSIGSSENILCVVTCKSRECKDCYSVCSL